MKTKGRSSLRKLLKKFQFFKKVISLLIRAKENAVDKDELLEALQEEMSSDEAQETLRGIIELGRYAELIGYNPEDKEIYLDKLEEA